MKKLFIVVVLSLTAYITRSDNKKEYHPDAWTLIEVWLEAQKDYEDLPGLTAIAIHDQDVIWKGAFGYANPEENIEATPSSLYSICSISKLFTAVAVMQLYDLGKLRLDDRVSDILPWYDLQQDFAESGPVTIRGLLSHSSGLPREANFPYWTGPDFPFPRKEAIIEQLKNQETLYPASTYLQYSNLALTLLGYIMEEVSGETFDNYIQQNILDPLGLNNTYTTLPPEKYGKELAIGYSAETREGERNQVSFFQANGIVPAAGFASNVEDLGKFASWQFRLRDTTETEILKPSTIKNMHNVHWTDPDFNATWGLGFSVFKGPGGVKWVGHGGSCPGYQTTLRINPSSEMAFSVMINALGTNPNKYFEGMLDILNKSEKIDKDASPDFSPDDYVGFYNQQPWQSESYIASWGDKLAILYLPADSPDNSMRLYQFVDVDTFKRIRSDDELGETLIFERDESGKVFRFKTHGNYSQRIER